MVISIYKLEVFIFRCFKFIIILFDDFVNELSFFLVFLMIEIVSLIFYVFNYFEVFIILYVV